MTARKTTVLFLGVLLGISVAALMAWAAPRPLTLVRLGDDFSVRTFMEDDMTDPVPQQSEEVFFPATEEGVVRTTEPVPPPPARVKPERLPDPLEMHRTRRGAYDPLPSPR